MRHMNTASQGHDPLEPAQSTHPQKTNIISSERNKWNFQMIFTYAELERLRYIIIYMEGRGRFSVLYKTELHILNCVCKAASCSNDRYRVPALERNFGGWQFWETILVRSSILRPSLESTPLSVYKGRK